MKKILFDTYVVSLMLSDNMPEKWIKEKIYWLKSLPKVEIHPLTDSDAIKAGEIKVSHDDLSLVDCYILSIGKRRNSIILTTDHVIRDAGKKLGIEVNFCSFPNMNSD